MPHVPEELADAVRRAYVAPVDDATAERHVAAIAAAARETGTTPSPERVPVERHRRRAWRPALAVGLSAVLLPAGLAVAGVDLPDAVEKPYEVVGVELPNQASETAEERTKDVRTAPPAGERPVDELPVSPVVPDGGVREGHGADDARQEESRREGERRSEERNKGRRGNEASDGKRQGGENGTRRSTERSNGRRGAQQRNGGNSNSRKSPQARPEAPAAGTDARGGRRGRGATETAPDPVTRRETKPKKVAPPASGGVADEADAPPPDTAPGRQKNQ